GEAGSILPCSAKEGASYGDRRAILAPATAASLAAALL
ncbi:MAG: hypothetical protein AVDCRST_MAG55-529, partial [uncultured Rubrobacteraceae bacterium]